MASNGTLAEVDEDEDEASNNATMPLFKTQPLGSENDTLPELTGDHDMDLTNETWDGFGGFNGTDSGNGTLDEDLEGSSAECQASEFGCCPDGRTSATGPDNEGCPKKTPRLRTSPMVPIKKKEGACKDTDYGCCADGETAALGPQREGCPETDCALSEHGCCPDGVTFANGPNYEECPHLKPMKQSKFCVVGTCLGKALIILYFSVQLVNWRTIKVPAATSRSSITTIPNMEIATASGMVDVTATITE